MHNIKIYSVTPPLSRGGIVKQWGKWRNNFVKFIFHYVSKKKNY